MAADPHTEDAPLAQTPLDALHRRLGGKMVPFAGYAMPVQYPTGILTEHNWTRDQAGLFDVSHMGQVELTGAGVDAALETIVPGDLLALAVGRMRYTQFTNDQGGILDDLMVLRLAADRLVLVVNAACKQQDIAHLRTHLTGFTVTEWPDRALLALQGPQAATVLARLAPAAATLAFMAGAEMSVGGVPCLVTRSGYTGEDGYEISIPADQAEALAETLLAQPEVKPIGLGARDSLRLEAGLCLYGHDITTDTSPVEADLLWSISKRRRAEGGFPGAAIVQAQIAQGPARRRVGFKPQGRLPAREGAAVRLPGGEVIGVVTSGGFGPTVNGPVAMGYVASAHAAPGTDVELIVRDKPVAATIVAMPFAPHRYHR